MLSVSLSLLCFGPYLKHFTCTNSVIIIKSPINIYIYYFCPHLTYKRIEFQEYYVTIPRSQNSKGQGHT